MPDLKDIADFFSQLYSTISTSSAGTTLVFVGVVFLLITVLTSYKAIILKPEEISSWMKSLLFVSVAATLIFSVSGVALPFVVRPASTIDRMPPSAAMKDLHDNKRVTWAIRLIEYNPNKNDELSIGKLKSLGKSLQLFAFVSDYFEVRGYKVADAVRMLGGPSPRTIMSLQSFFP